MSNHSLAARSATTPLSNSSNATSQYPSPLDKIAANDLTSRANYIYSFLALLGFISGCFLLYTFIQSYRAQRRLAWLDRLLWAFCVLQLLLLLLSLHAVAYRPDYLRATGLGCAALSFAINATSLCSLLVLVLMAYVLTLDPPSHGLLRKPRLSAALVILASVLTSVLLAGLRGPRAALQEDAPCFMDPFEAGVTYAAARLCLTFAVPVASQAGLLVAGCVRQWKTKGRFLSGSEEGPVFLAVALVASSCQLFYGVALLRGARLHAATQPEEKHTWERAFLSVAELVLFSASGASLLLVLLVHRPCREGLVAAVRQLSDCCGGRGRTQPHRNIIAAHIEVRDSLQDVEDEGSSRRTQLF